MTQTSTADIRTPYRNTKLWSTTDGHRYVSVPTTVPLSWERTSTEGVLVYRSNPYKIVRCWHGDNAWVYKLFRDGVVVSWPFFGLLRDAQAAAVRNAEGRDVVNVA